MDFKKERIHILGGGWYKVTLISDDEHEAKPYSR